MSSHKISQVFLTLQAKEDLQDILQNTEETWGSAQRKKYSNAIRKALKNLKRTPFIGHTSIALAKDYRILHIEKHLAVYKVEKETIFIFRILHQNQDIKRHL